MFAQIGQTDGARINGPAADSKSVDSRTERQHGEESQTSFTPTGSLMDFVLQPWQLYLVILAGWINRQQQEVIEYLRTENQVLKEKFGKKRIMLSDDQRRRLAVKGKILGRKRLEEVGTLFTPDTILRWHRQLVALKWDYSDRRKANPGRPRLRQVIVELILRFARENPSWATTESRVRWPTLTTTSPTRPWVMFSSGTASNLRRSGRSRPHGARS